MYKKRYYEIIMQMMREKERESKKQQSSLSSSRVYNSLNFKPIIAHYCYLQFPLFTKQKKKK